MSSWLAGYAARSAVDLVKGELGDGERQGRRDDGDVHPDERIRQELLQRLEADPEAAESDIDVKVIAGVVTLSGTVSSEAMKQRSLEACAKLGPDFRIEDKLRVQSGESR